MNYHIRKNCIFCNNKLNHTFFEKDYYTSIAHYTTEEDKNDKMLIPYNVYICEKCKTVQTKYLGKLEEIYKINHADSTGETMKNLHKKVCEIIMKYKDEIYNILEIGSACGVLSNEILSIFNTKYYIIEPNFFGNKENKIIINDFYENIQDDKIEANTLIISHVFEHFYNPIEILNKIYRNENIINFFLIFPDLEYYINNNILHVLNTEHTYYIDNDFLIKLLDMYGFKLMLKEYYKNHSVIFYFKRYGYEKKELEFINKNYDLTKFYTNIFEIVKKYNNIITNKNIYIFPASIHTLFLFTFGLEEAKVDGFVDNSKLKIGKKMYSTNLMVYNFMEIIKQKDVLLLLNGGIFNNEITKILKDNNIEYY